MFSKTRKRHSTLKTTTNTDSSATLTKNQSAGIVNTISIPTTDTHVNSSSTSQSKR